MKLGSPILALSLASLCCLPLVACSSTKTKSSEPTKENAAKPAAKEEEAEKLAKKQFELECSKIDMQLKKLNIENKERGLAVEIEDAERELRNAREALEVFTRHEKPLKLDSSQLELEESEQFRKQRQQELDELMAMYKQEELAALTKELVISRETKALEFAKRRYERQVKTTEHAKTVEVPKKERELTEAVARAERKLADSKSKAERSKLESKLELMKAERALAELEKEVAKLDKQDGAA